MQNITLCDCNWTRTHNHLVRKRTLNHLAKLTRFTLKRESDMTRTYSHITLSLILHAYNNHAYMNKIAAFYYVYRYVFSMAWDVSEPYCRFQGLGSSREFKVLTLRIFT